MVRFDLGASRGEEFPRDRKSLLHGSLNSVPSPQTWLLDAIAASSDDVLLRITNLRSSTDLGPSSVSG